MVEFMHYIFLGWCTFYGQEEFKGVSIKHTTRPAYASKIYINIKVI